MLRPETCGLRTAPRAVGQECDARAGYCDPARRDEPSSYSVCDGGVLGTGLFSREARKLTRGEVCSYLQATCVNTCGAESCAAPGK